VAVRRWSPVIIFTLILPCGTLRPHQWLPVWGGPLSRATPRRVKSSSHHPCPVVTQIIRSASFLR
jgi:hypothetical protein